MIAIYTYHNPEGAEEEKDDFQYQAIAYSLDKGRSWTKYQQNPVVPNPGIRDFRDPKVIWHKGTGKWLMVFAAFDHVKFYSSPDLKEWTWVNDFGLNQGSHGGVWECPDLFPLNSPSGEEKWVLIVSLGDGAPNGGSGTQYFIGQFDGETFRNDNSANVVLWLDYGRDNYAGVTWSDIPEDDGRRIFIGWMSNWRYAQQVPTYRWRSAMTLPRELKLENTPAGIRLLSMPVEEVQVLHDESQLVPNQTISQGQSLYLETSFNNRLSLIELTVTPSEGAEFIVEIGNSESQKIQIAYDSEQNKYSLDRSASGNMDFSDEFGGIHYAPRISEDQTINLKIYLDHSSLEVFVDNGEVVLTELIFPIPEYDQISLHSLDGTTQIQQGKITQLRSIW
jgi:fructan beta-fructosidase